VERSDRPFPHNLVTAAGCIGTHCEPIYRQACRSAVDDFIDQRADEDRITGTVATALRTGVAGEVEVDGKMYRWSTRLPGMGPRSEKVLGADAVLEFRIVEPDGTVAAAKVLPIQAKKEWTANRDRRLRQQAQKMLDAFGSGLVVDYRASGYAAVAAAQAVAAGGDRRKVAPADLMTFEDALGGRFLECTLGTSGVTYNESKGTLVPIGRTSGKVAPTNLVVRTTVEAPERVRTATTPTFTCQSRC
jgi:hypothetical protein